MTHSALSRPLGLGTLREEMDRWFHGVLGAPWAPERTVTYPPLRLWETEQALIAEFEVPGLSLDALDVEVIGNELTLRGAHAGEKSADSVYHRRERPVGAFERTVRIPVDVDATRVEAQLKDGVLTINLPKAEAAKPRKIAIRSGS